MPPSSSIIAGAGWFRFSDMIGGCRCRGSFGADGNDRGGWIQRQQEQGLIGIQSEDGLGSLPALVALPPVWIGLIPGDGLRWLQNQCLLGYHAASAT